MVKATPSKSPPRTRSKSPPKRSRSRSSQNLERRKSRLAARKKRQAAEEGTNKDFKKHEKDACCHHIKFHDETIEFFDKYSNVDVGTEFDTFFHGEQVGFNLESTENYVLIVDLDSFEYHKIGFHGFLGEILQSAFFRFSILLLVLFNSVLIGLNTHPETVRLFRTYFQTLEQIILSIFIFEILLKWLYDFQLFWSVWWNILDFTIVFLIIMSSIIPALGARREIFAMIRVVRAFRILRSVSSLTSLNVVTHTIVKSVGDMLNILFVLILFMFVMAIAGVTIFDIPELETAHFLNTFDAWFVLFICVSQDGWVSVLDEFRPAIEDRNFQLKQNYFIMIAIYLMIGVAIGAFVFTNLIVAVVVANLELAVRELRSEMLETDNPLEYNGEFSTSIVEVLSVYTLLAEQNIPLLGQRPMKIPCLKNMSRRRIQAYISLIVAFEQSMLEFVLIERDLKKIMSVLLTIAKQLEGSEESEKKGKEKIFSMDFFKNLEIPPLPPQPKLPSKK